MKKILTALIFFIFALIFPNSAYSYDFYLKGGLGYSYISNFSLLFKDYPAFTERNPYYSFSFSAFVPFKDYFYLESSFFSLGDRVNLLYIDGSKKEYSISAWFLGFSSGICLNKNRYYFYTGPMFGYKLSESFDADGIDYDTSFIEDNGVFWKIGAGKKIGDKLILGLEYFASTNSAFKSYNGKIFSFQVILGYKL